MTRPVLSFGALPDLPLLLAITGLTLALALTGWAFRHRTARPQSRPSSPAVKVAALAALGCTAYSADTSWSFAGDYLGMDGTAERAALFGVAELALFATALMARQNLAIQGVPGLPGTLVWIITGVQVIPAYAESGPVGGTVRAVVGPIMAAVLWHQAMGIELRLRTPGAASHGLIATLGREARERLLSRLGIAARDRDAAQITRDRATTRAVALASRLAERTPEQQQSWRGRRLTRRLSQAIGRAAVGTDPAQRGELLAQLAARRHALTLATTPLPSPWSPHQDSKATVTVPVPKAQNIAVPIDGAFAHTRPTEGRGPDKETGPILGTGDPDGGTDTGTEPTGDRGPSNPDTGTEPTGDRGNKVPLRGKPTSNAKGNGKRGGRSRSSQIQRPPREPEQSVEHLVQQVRPHVPALLARDGTEAVTRVQLREILRRQGLKGARNEKLSLVLQQLRSEENTTRTRSTAR